MSPPAPGPDPAVDPAAPGVRVLAADRIAAWDGPPLVLFVGVVTGGSLVHAVFPRWAARLGRPWVLRGVDLPLDAPPAAFRDLLAAALAHPAVAGAVVTSHKLRLHRACADQLARLDRRDPLVALTHEVNTLVTGPGTPGGTAAHARDALSLDRVLPGLAALGAAGTDGTDGAGSGAGFAGRHVLVLGAGGAATALVVALHRRVGPDGALAPRPDVPARVVVADVDGAALDGVRAVAARAGLDPAALDLVAVDGPAACDALVADAAGAAAAGAGPALVVNATGLGKDGPASPTTDAAPFGPATVAWDLNYRGPLPFLGQARRRGAPTADGWELFVAGWAGGLSAIAGVPFTPDLLAGFAAAAAPHRPARPTVTDRADPTDPGANA